MGSITNEMKASGSLEKQQIRLSSVIYSDLSELGIFQSRDETNFLNSALIQSTMKTYLTDLLLRHVIHPIRSLGQHRHLAYTKVGNTLLAQENLPSSELCACVPGAAGNEKEKDAIHTSRSKDWQKGIENLEEALFIPLSYYLEGYKIHEIADHLGQRPEYIEQQIAEAKRVLAKGHENQGK